MLSKFYSRASVFPIIFGLLFFFPLASNSFGEPFISSDEIDAYLLGKSSPITEHGSVFVTNGLTYDVDPRLVIAIAGAETSFGTDMGCNASFNAWSWFWNEGSCSNSPFLSWEEGIATVSKYMRLSYLNKGFTSIPLIGSKYCAEGCEYWEPNVTRFYRDRDELGGNTSDLGFSGEEEPTTWARIYGTYSYTDDKLYSIAMTEDGNYIAAGYKYDNTKSGYDSVQIWILKLDTKGEVLWQRTYGGGYARSIQQTADGGFVISGSTWPWYYGDVFVLKLDEIGNFVWKRMYGSDRTDDAYFIQQTADGGYVIAGKTDSFDAWILKLDANGYIDWQKKYRSSEANSIQQTFDGGYIVAGKTYSYQTSLREPWILKLNADGNEIWQKVYAINIGLPRWLTNRFSSIQETIDGGFIVAGMTYSFGAGSSDIWVLKLNESGDVIWQKAYGGANLDIAHVIRQTNDGGYIVAGGRYNPNYQNDNTGAWDGYVLKLNSEGIIIWEKVYGRHWLGLYGGYLAYSIQQTLDNGYILALSQGFTFLGANYPALILKIDTEGNISSSCQVIGSSDTIVIDTNVVPEESYAISFDTIASVTDTTVIPVDTNASIETLCYSDTP